MVMMVLNEIGFLVLLGHHLWDAESTALKFFLLAILLILLLKLGLS